MYWITSLLILQVHFQVYFSELFNALFSGSAYFFHHCLYAKSYEVSLDTITAHGTNYLQRFTQFLITSESGYKEMSCDSVP